MPGNGHALPLLVLQEAPAVYSMRKLPTAYLTFSQIFTDILEAGLPRYVAETAKSVQSLMRP